MVSVLVIFDVVFAFALMAAILFQTGYSAGISGAFGGGAPQSYGSKKKGVDDFLERVTMVLGILFVIVTAILAHLWK